MILTSSWDVTVTDIVPYTFEPARLPRQYVGYAYDTVNSLSGDITGSVKSIVRTLGDTSTLIKGTCGAYVELRISNAYDVILLDTIDVAPFTV